MTETEFALKQIYSWHNWIISVHQFAKLELMVLVESRLQEIRVILPIGICRKLQRDIPLSVFWKYYAIA